MDYNHKSLHKDIFGYIDSIQNLEQDLFTITCWYSFTDDRKIKELRIKEDNVEYLDTAFSIPRQDVVKYYNNANLINCGNILVIRTKNTKITIQAKSNNVWYDINEIDLTKYVAVLNPKFNKVNDKVPTLIAIDDFYTYPDEVRKMALNLDYAPSQYHKGKRTKSKLVIEGTKEKLEKVLGKKITNWTETHAHCGVFQHCTPIDPIVYHYDGQSHAAVVFLTPNAPVTTGTSFFRHKSLHWLDKAPVIGENDIKSQSQITEIEAKFIGTEHDDFLDGTKWEEIDRIGNKYNRLAIWDAKLIHAATQYFGKNLNDSRLFHMFFFDIEQ
tara:strand:- start:1140 stop:2120 length:981 start_codon:yes stop_codon:yes gene_type:complete